MLSVFIVRTVAAVVIAPLALAAQAPRHGDHRHGAAAQSDSTFTALQQRGKRIMGVDQYTSSHRFEALVEGGRIELQRDLGDTVGVRTIRDHLRRIAREFAAGDFSASGAVHAQSVPGTAVMRARRRAIRYEVRDLPRGGEVRITTRDQAALRAVHEFLAFQRVDHRTGEK